MDSDIETRKNRFISALSTGSTTNIVRQHITFGDSYILNDDSHFRLKAAVADHFDIHPSEVVLVGSAKLGFSIAPKKRYLPFGDNSDIDLAIVSPNFFDVIWREVFDYSREVGYWANEKVFKDYLFKGWIRPDKLPPAATFKIGVQWWEFFRNLVKTDEYGPYKIAAGLYKSWYYFESYQGICVEQCKNAVELH